MSNTVLQNIQEEHRELAKKVLLLRRFAMNNFPGASPAQKNLLMAQLESMQQYVHILCLREDDLMGVEATAPITLQSSNGEGVS